MSQSTSTAQQTPLRKLLTADEAKIWQAVGKYQHEKCGVLHGRLDRTRSGTDSSTLYVQSLKLAALIDPNDIEFLAGWRSGRAGAERKARRVVIHKNYVPGRHVKVDKVANDIAIIELALPITANFIKAFEYHKRPKLGDDVKVVSYAQDRAEAPSIEEPCQVIGLDPRALILTCNVDYGASGSPILVIGNFILPICTVYKIFLMFL